MKLKKMIPICEDAIKEHFSVGEIFTSDMLKNVLPIEMSGIQIGITLHAMPSVRRVSQGHLPRGQSLWEVIQ